MNHFSNYFSREWTFEDLKCDRPGLTRHHCVHKCKDSTVADVQLEGNSSALLCTTTSTVKRCACAGTSVELSDLAVYRIDTGKAVGIPGYKGMTKVMFCLCCPWGGFFPPSFFYLRFSWRVLPPLKQPIKNALLPLPHKVVNGPKMTHFAALLPLLCGCFSSWVDPPPPPPPPPPSLAVVPPVHPPLPEVGQGRAEGGAEGGEDKVEGQEIEVRRKRKTRGPN